MKIINELLKTGKNRSFNITSSNSSQVFKGIANRRNIAIYSSLKYKDDFKKIALDVIHSEGFNYNVNINIGNFNFPTKNYGDISLPAGMYDALRVEIGNSNGQNWWCVMFPSLCFIDINHGIVEKDSKNILENELSKESYAIISDKSKSTVKFKFKILEFFGQNNISTAKN